MGKQLVLISHGSFCVELKNSTEMIMGPQDFIHAVPLFPEEGADDFKRKLEETLSTLEDVVVMADLAGGTPCNVAAKLLMTGHQFKLYTGMNMPMIISFINGELIGSEANIIGEAQEGIRYLNDLLLSDDDEDEDE